MRATSAGERNLSARICGAQRTHFYYDMRAPMLCATNRTRRREMENARGGAHIVCVCTQILQRATTVSREKDAAKFSECAYNRMRWKMSGAASVRYCYVLLLSLIYAVHRRSPLPTAKQASMRCVVMVYTSAFCRCTCGVANRRREMLHGDGTIVLHLRL